MSELDGFSIRVYGLCINNSEILCLHEKYQGQIYCKLPGGGLEFGEGIIECLKREFKEELNVNIEIVNHLYTQEDYVESYVKNGKQLLFIYYIVNIVDIENLKIIDDNIIDVVWKDLESKKPFNFLIDNIAVQKYTDS